METELLMNNEAKKIWKELLDVNLELSEAQSKAMKLKMKYEILEDRLREVMGEEEYKKFNERGKAMFTIKK
jgi:hypothetical protein